MAGPGHFLTALKAFKTQNELHHCLATHWKKDSVTFLRLVKYLMLKKDTIIVLAFLIPKKVSITFLWLLKLLILKKGCIIFLRFLKFLILKKDFVTSLRLLKALILKNDSIPFLWLLNFFIIAILQNAGEQPLLKVAYHIIFTVNVVWVPNFTALRIYFLFGTKFSRNEGIDTCFDAEYVFTLRLFWFSWWLLVGYCLLPVGYCSLLVVSAHYCSLLLDLTFSMNGKVLVLRYWL